MKKNTIIIIALITGLIIVIIFLAFLNARKKQMAESALPPSPPAATLPPAQGATNKTIDDFQNIKAIQQVFGDVSREPVSDQAISSGIERIRLRNKDGVALPLDNFETAVGMQVNPQLKQFLDSSNYEVFYCPGNDNGKNFGIFLGYDIGKAYGNLYPDTLTWMKDWEKSILKDLHSVLFPNINFSESDLSQKLDFRNGKFRFSSVQLPDGQSSSINYAVIGDGILASSSPACLEKTVSLYEPVQP
jgi:hypothetical protein